MMFFEMVFGYMPFYGNSPDDLYETITTTSLKFPKNNKLSSNSKDFLLRALTIDEKERISWQELLNHQVFEKI